MKKRDQREKLVVELPLRSLRKKNKEMKPNRNQTQPKISGGRASIGSDSLGRNILQAQEENGLKRNFVAITRHPETSSRMSKSSLSFESK